MPGNKIGDYPSNNDPTGGLCTVGKYCPANSSKQFNCGSGTYMPHEMATASGDCVACPPGKYCDSAGLSDLTSKDCTAGYYCTGSADNAVQNACGYDEKCVAGTLWPV